METVLVTGAAGFIGSNLARELLNRGYDVRGLDNFETGRESNVADIRDHDRFSFTECDLRDYKSVVEVVDGTEYVFHQAAVPSVPRSVDDPRLSTDVNCTGTANLLEAARETGVSKVVSASSSSVYGSSVSLPKRETMETDPESPYALSKYFTEKLTLQFDTLYDIDTVALRYFNIFGPRQDPNGQYAPVVPKFINLLLDGERPTIYGDGEQSRDFTYIDNAVQANIAAATADVSGEAYNIACGERTTINELVSHLNDVLGTGLEPVHESPRPGDVRHSKADVSKAVDHLGYEPAVPVTEGLRRTVEWFRTDDPA